jgi:hypothetical protein
MNSLIAFVVGFSSGWAVRSVSDSPEGVGVKLIEVASAARERLSRWVAVEQERFEDMLAEARANAAQNGANGQAGEKDPR